MNRSLKSSAYLLRGLQRAALAFVAIATVVMHCGAAVASAFTSGPVELSCPYDGTKFSFDANLQGDVFVEALDFRNLGGTSPAPLPVCPINGFVFFKNDFGVEELERLRPLVLSPEFRALKDETPYYRAAWLGERAGSSHVEVSLTLLQATWEASEAPQRYERYATELIARLPKDLEESSNEQKKMFELLLGELLRRTGKFPEAKQYFLDLSRGLARTDDEYLIALFEIQLIDKKDTQSHLMFEAIETGEKNQELWLARRTPVLSDGRFLKQTHLLKFDDSYLIHWVTGSRLIGNARTGLILFDLLAGTTTVRTPAVRLGNDVEFSQDGKTIITDGTVPDGGGIVAMGDWHFFQIDATTFEVRHSVQVPTPGTQEFAMAHDGKSALAELENRLVAFDLGTDAWRTLPSPIFSKGREAWWLVSADPTGPRVVLNHEDAIVIWDYEKGEQVHRIQPKDWIKSMTPIVAIYSSDGKKLFVASDAYWDAECELTAWDALTGAQLFRTRVKGGPGAQLAVSPDDSLVGLACGKSLHLWDSKLAGPPFETFAAKGRSEFREFTFSPDSRQLAVRLDDALLVYSIAR